MAYDTADDWEIVARTHGARPRRARELRGALRAGHRARHRRGAPAGARVRASRPRPGAATPTTSRSSATLADRHDRRRHRAVGATRPRPPTRRATRELGAFLRDEYAPDGRSARRGRRRALRAVGARVQRHRPRPRRDVRVGLGGAVPHRGRDARRSASASCPATRSRAVIEHLEPTTARARSKASTSSGTGTRSSSTGRSPSSTARTSTSPNRSTGARR